MLNCVYSAVKRLIYFQIISSLTRTEYVLMFFFFNPELSNSWLMSKAYLHNICSNQKELLQCAEVSAVRTGVWQTLVG